MNIYSQPALYTHHAMTMNVHHYHYYMNIENFDINKICSLSELVSLYEKENNAVKYEYYKEHENYDYYDDDDDDYDYDDDYDDGGVDDDDDEDE